MYIETFGEAENKQYFFSPGRVNLIGEHTDYNGGHVFPCTISLGTYGVATLRDDKVINCYSKNFDGLGVVEVALNQLKFDEKHEWINFVKGVILQFEKRGYILEQGFNLAIDGNIPGGGLSSSSSVELLVCVMIKSLYGFDIDMLEMIKLSRAVENDYMGVNCGIMDQFIIGMGKENHAILLDTNTLEYKHVPLELGDHVILIGNTNKKRTLAASKYNERFSECQQALAMIKKSKDIQALGELSPEAFETLKHHITDPILQKRAKHAVYENQRTVLSYEALMRGELITFGEYMNASHVSLREDYEVSCLELDTMVELMQQQDGVIGSRMTGAGFGGCTVTIIKQACVEAAIENVSEAYKKTIGYAGDFHVVNIGRGAGYL